MKRVRITLPAVVTDFGPALQSLGIALKLRTSLEFSERNDDQLHVVAGGVDADLYPELEHPALLACIRVFQRYERAPKGFQVKVENPIPLMSGLGAEAAFTVAGVIGASNLLDLNLSRDRILNEAAQIMGRADGITASMIGGVATAILLEDRVLYRQISSSLSGDVVVILPDVKQYNKRISRALPRLVSYEDTLLNLSRVPAVLDAFQRDQLASVASLLEDRVKVPTLQKIIPGYDEVVQSARQAGAFAVGISGLGPAMVAFAQSNHVMIAEAMQAAFLQQEVPSRVWILPLDRQGVVITMTQSA